MKAVANSTALDVDASTCGEIGGVGLHVGADHLTLDSAFEGHVNKLALMGEGRVTDGHRDLAVHEVHEDGERNQNDSDDESKNEAHTCLFPPPQEFIVEHGRGVSGKKRRGASKRSQSR